jgi:hypothetical protein
LSVYSDLFSEKVFFTTYCQLETGVFNQSSDKNVRFIVQKKIVKYILLHTIIHFIEKKLFLLRYKKIRKKRLHIHIYQENYNNNRKNRSHSQYDIEKETIYEEEFT